MNKIIILAVLSCSCLSVQAQLYINGSLLKIEQDAILLVNSDFVNENGSDFQNNGTVNVKGNVTNRQEMSSSGTGTFSFAGTSKQIISGLYPLIVQNVEINNTAGLELNAPLKIEGACKFSNGILTTVADNSVVFMNGSSISIAPSNICHINGSVIKEGIGNFDYPIGNGTHFQKVTLNLTSNPMGMKVTYSPGDAGSDTYGNTGTDSTPLVDRNKAEHWNMTPLSTAEGKVTICWDNYKMQDIAHISHLKVAHLSNGSWLNDGATSVNGNVVNGNITSNTVITWGIYTLGSINLVTLCPSCFSARLYNNGSMLTIGENAKLHINGNFTNEDGSDYRNDGTVNVMGNVTNRQDMSSTGSGLLCFAGTSKQIVSGMKSLMAKNVEINNPAGVDVYIPLKIEGAFQFTKGIINTPADDPLYFMINSSIGTVPSNTSHVNGAVIKEGIGQFDYPVGDGTQYQKVTLDLTSNATGMKVTYKASDAGTAPYGTYGTDVTPLVAHNAKEYWDITPLSTAEGKATIYWDNYKNSGIADVSHLKVAHLAGGNWLNEGGISATGDASSGSVTSNTVSTWSPYTLGSINLSSSLPVSLLSFTGQVTGNENHLSWTTVSEKNNKGFDIQRSTNGIVFTEVGFQEGHNTTNNINNYIFIDKQPLIGINYYRLKQIDFNDKTTYSNVIALYNKGSLISLYPNPTIDEVYINISKEWVNYTISNAIGQVVKRGIGRQYVPIRVHDLPKGIYHISINSQILKFVKE